MVNWSQPICEACWIAREATYEGGGTAGVIKAIRRPSMVRDSEIELCAWCGSLTIMGIFVRADPESVPYPKEDSEAESGQ